MRVRCAILAYAAILVAGFAGIGWVTWQHIQPPLFAQYSVVAVTAELPDIDIEIIVEPKKTIRIANASAGTGFALGNRIYTCEHVVHGARNVYVTLRDGRYQWGRVLRTDTGSDLAEIQIGDMPAALGLRTYPPRFFETVYQIGNPGELRWVVTRGNFITFDMVENRFLLDTWFGNSGSPILDARGSVIGMTHDIIRGTRFTGGGTLQELRNFINPATPR